MSSERTVENKTCAAIFNWKHETASKQGNVGKSKKKEFCKGSSLLNIYPRCPPPNRSKSSIVSSDGILVLNKMYKYNPYKQHIYITTLLYNQTSKQTWLENTISLLTLWKLLIIVSMFIQSFVRNILTTRSNKETCLKIFLDDIFSTHNKYLYSTFLWNNSKNVNIFNHTILCYPSLIKIWPTKQDSCTKNLEIYLIFSLRVTHQRVV